MNNNLVKTTVIATMIFSISLVGCSNIEQEHSITSDVSAYITEEKTETQNIKKITENQKDLIENISNSIREDENFQQAKQDAIQTAEEKREEAERKKEEELEKAKKLKEVDKSNPFIMYVSSPVNVRTGPGVEYDKIGQYKRKDQVMIYAEENDWCAIDYEGNIAYVSAKYLQENEPEEIKYSTNDTGVFGNAGRFYFHDYSAALYKSNEQYVVDAQDSAAAFMEDGTLVIADHKNQGFDVIKSAEVGDICEIKQSDGTSKKYECIKTDSGLHNLGEGILDHNWETFVYGQSDLFTYTCNENWKNVTGVFWNEI